ncbi:MAG: Ig-like domain-containing protein, partial [Steroidobacteraceae bacterium]
MTVIKQSSLLVLAACLGLILVGCQPSDPDAPKVADITAIAVTPSAVSLEIGGVQALTVTGTYSDDSTYIVNFGSTFVSSAPAIAAVDSSTGYVTAVAAGNATITATHTASGKTATTAVTVAPLRVVAIVVSPATNALTVGATQALTVTATYNNTTTGPVTAGSTFVSSNLTVATVDAAGIVAAVAEGAATITATHTASGTTGTAAVTVSASFTSITFDSAGVVYTLTGFNGAEDSSLQPDPTNAINTVVRVNRAADA